MNAPSRAWFAPLALLAFVHCAPSPCPAQRCPDDHESVDASRDSAADAIDEGTNDDASALDAATRDASTNPDVTSPTDASADAQGGFVLLPTDTLAVRTPQLIAGNYSLVCVRLEVQRDGARFTLPDEAITAVTTRTSDATVARPASASECASVGAVTLAPGEITVDADVVVQSRTLPVRYSIRVLDAPVTVFRDSLLTGTMHLDEPRSFAPSSLRPAAANAGGTLAEWLHITASSPAISVAAGANGRWTVTGRALGEATLVASYGPPGHEQDVRAAEPIRVVTPGTLARVEEMLFRYDSGEETAQFRLEPGACANVALRAWYQPSSGAMYWATTTDATFVAAGATRIATSAPPRVCADRRGESTIRGCIGSVCRERMEFVSSPGARFVLEPATATATRVDASSSRACVALRGAVLFADGERVEIPFATLTRWISLSQSTRPFASILHTIESGPADELCFRAATADREYVLQAQAYQFAGRITVTVR